MRKCFVLFCAIFIPVIAEAQTNQAASLVQAHGQFSLIHILQGIGGILSIIAIAWLLSTNRKSFPWRTVVSGLVLQLLIAFGLLFVPWFQSIFAFAGSLFVKVLDFTRIGTAFVFGGLLDTQKSGYIFAFQILPTIIFFSALTSLFFYLGVLQRIVKVVAWFFSRTMRISGPEGLCAASNIFLGQTEAPLLIKSYLPRMTAPEILVVMTTGMATMAGGVLASYISFLGGEDPVMRLVFARHLLAASVMAAPGALVIARILLPQKNEPTYSLDVDKQDSGGNVLESITNGTVQGLKLAVIVGAMLLVFIGLVAFMNFIFLKAGVLFHINEHIKVLTQNRYNGLSLEFILGYLFSPVMNLIGVTGHDSVLLGQLLGKKVILNEFIGYSDLAALKSSGVLTNPRSILMATYLLCGFANIGSIGMQIGGIGALAPNQQKLISSLGFRALLGGTLSALLSASIIGMIL
jgi:CNT family concentrative nucleoside transporter